MAREILVSEEELVIIENALDEAREYLRKDLAPNTTILKEKISAAEQIVSDKLSITLSEQSWSIWFTKTGFIQHHKKLMDDLQKVQEDRLREFFIHTKKPSEHQDVKLISQLNYDIRENAKLLSELSLISPHGINIKKKIIESYQKMKSTGYIDPERGDIQR
ncbi:MAG TPA: hypothetical protein VE594_03630 [Nitrososphaeraceae archaeon]|nr:hypothetical protein [Nitrososphaeraceae archaeon]